MTTIKLTCAICGIEYEKYIGHYNRAIKMGYNVFCSHKCGMESRRTTVEEKKAKKAAYDKENIKRPEIKAKRKAYNETPKGREAQKRRRQTRMPKHVEYCRQPEYKAKKVIYDREHKAKKLYGEFWESAILIEQINNKLTDMADKADLRVIQKTYNKSIRRKRQWLRLLQNLRQLT